LQASLAEDRIKQWGGGEEDSRGKNDQET